ncbi:MAG: hypothetical protein ACMG57_00505 [Candidatus Dojkabacteria bacterium]
MVEELRSNEINVVLSAEDEIKINAQRMGHENWRSSNETLGYSLSYPDDKSHMKRDGLVPFSYLVELEVLLKDVEVSEQIEDADALEFLKRILSDEKVHWSSEFKKEVMEIEEGQSDLQLVKDWMFKLAKDWSHRNDNWANRTVDLKDLLVKSFGDISNPDSRKQMIEKLMDLKSQAVRFKSYTTLIEMFDFLANLSTKDKTSMSLPKILILVHGGWREGTYKDSNLNLYKSNDFLDFNTIIPEVSVRSRINTMEAYLTNISYKAINVEEYISSQVSNIRKMYEKGEMPANKTFKLIFDIGFELERLKERMSKKSLMNKEKLLDQIQKQIDGIEETMKFDANTGMFDVLIKFLVNYED